MTAASLLDSRWIGVVHLDRRGRIVAVNAGARAIFRRDDVLSDRDGVLRAARQQPCNLLLSAPTRP